VLGSQRGTKRELEEALKFYKQALQEYSRERVPLDWAMTQNNLGNALLRLGERESGTERLEAAVAAYREALKEYKPQPPARRVRPSRAGRSGGTPTGGSAPRDEAVCLPRLCQVDDSPRVLAQIQPMRPRLWLVPYQAMTSGWLRGTYLIYLLGFFRNSFFEKHAWLGFFSYNSFISSKPP
jgi:tetratricopeptide (TPR) repeat protein